MQQRIVILGGSGFIGGSLSRPLSSLGQGRIVQAFSSQDCNLLFPDSINRSLAGICQKDILIFSSAISRLKENTPDSMLKNIQMAQNLARFLIQHPVKQLIFFSSVDVYGCEKKDSISLPLSEGSPYQPDDCYALGKVASELFLEMTLKEQNIPLAILRFPGVYGPGDGQKSLVGLFMRKALKEKMITVFGDGKQLRNYTYVDDIAAVITEIMAHPLNGAVNVVSEKSYSILQIAEMVKRVVNNGCRIDFKKVSQPPSRSLDIVFINQEFKRIFPRIHLRDLRQGIKEYHKSLMENGA